jgi:DNA-binding NarL/FixJ family response regulator
MRNEVVIIDDHKIFGEGFCSLLENSNFRVKRVFQSPKKALYYLERNLVDIVFCDINMPEINGIELIKKIKKINLSCKVIMMSMYTQKNIIKKALNNNADGYLSKNCSVDDIKAVISNSFLPQKKIRVQTVDKNINNDEFSMKFSLTSREKEIINEILKEKSNSEIGEILQISKRTVETHRKNIMLKLDVKNSIGIAVKALKYELV